MKIAIADDEILILKYMTSLVQDLLPNAEISSFTSSVKFLESANETTYDIAFIDIQMPCYTGIEVAQMLKSTNPKINIIFVTGFDGFQSEAMELFVSGYVKKPATKEKIQLQLDNLRYPLDEMQKRIYAQTFGNFTLFVDGNPVKFARTKSLHAIAYLIHRRGAVVGRKELSSVIFDDGIYNSNRISYISKICSDIQTTLCDLDVLDFVSITPTGLSIKVDMLECDFYSFLNGSKNAKQKFQGEYMAQYEFGKETEATLTEQQAIDLEK